MATTGILFAVMWFLIAGYLFFLGVREDRFCLFIAPFFLFLGGWALADQISSADLMAGAYLWIYRGVAVVMLIICGIKYYIMKKNR